jgi:hypothetical protein
MPDTVRTRAALAALFADNASGDISAQDLRDFLASVTMAWALAGSWTYSTDAANVDFTDLGDYSELMILQRLVTCGTSGRVGYVVSSDNGATWRTTSGDYQAIGLSGTETAGVSLTPHSADSSSARSGVINVHGWKLAAQKPALVGRSDFVAWAITYASALNALRAAPTNGGNLTSGSIYVFGR